jgi:glycosyltransferase involved in cell wall biosynthesis
MSKARHILMLLKYIPDFQRDNKADLMASLIRSHEAAGMHVTLASLGRESGSHTYDAVSTALTDEVAHEVKQLSKSLEKAEQQNLRMRKRAESVVGRLGSRRIDAVLAYCTSHKPAILAQQVSELLGVPYVVVEHRAYDGRINETDDLDSAYLTALRSAGALYAVSPMLRDSMQRIGVRDDIGVLPNGIPESFFAAPETAAGGSPVPPYAVREGEFVVAAWTKWRDIKRLDVLIDGFLQFHQRYPQSRLIVAGELACEEHADYAKDRIAANSAESAVQWLGDVDRDTIHRRAHSSHCCVISSDLESFALAAIEAQAAGKPVIATRCFGPEFIICDRSLGRLVERNDPTALSAAMMEVCEQYESFDCESIQRRTFERFSDRALASAWSKVYDELREPSSAQ